MPPDSSAASAAVEVDGLGKRYRRGWALRDCSFRLPAGRICALVGPNGAGKSTLLGMAGNLVEPTEGTLRVFGSKPQSPQAGLRTAHLTNGKPLFRRFTVSETLRLGRELNPGWDQRTAERVVREGGVPLEAKVGSLSTGQHAWVAFALALGKRADLLLLDEPVSGLDPLVRHELMGTLMAEVAEHGTTVLMSSHLLSELESVCDYLVLIAAGAVRLAGEVDELLDAHTLLTGAQADEGVQWDLSHHTFVETRTSGRQVTALMRPHGPVGSGWQVDTPNLEELLLGYLRSPQAPALLTPSARIGDRIRDRNDERAGTRPGRPTGTAAQAPASTPSPDTADPSGRRTR